MSFLKATVAANIWKVDIMLGMYPMQTNMYKILGCRERIIDLYRKIRKVQYVGVKPSEVRKIFLDNSHFIDLLYDRINRNYDLTNQKQTIIFKLNNKLKMDMEEECDEQLIIIKLPTEDIDF